MSGKSIRIRHGLLLAGLFSMTAFGQMLRHVDDDTPPGGNGQTWTTASHFLQDALAEATGIVRLEDLRTFQFTDCNTNGTSDDADIANDP
ncbi:MAG: hypothetical protein V3T70_03645, partial [Phycisphaerae bacterium]